MQAVEVEREAVRLLPGILADLFDDATHSAVWQRADAPLDVAVEAGGRRWACEIKTSSGPGVVMEVAAQLASYEEMHGATPVLVVPYMTPGGAKAADEQRLNWIDLSGNASLRGEGLRIWVQGHPNRFAARGRPASAFAPKSSRVTRRLLLEPSRWWRQKDLAEATDLDAGRVSRVVHRLDDERLLERQGPQLRPRNADLLLDAWADDYRFDRHDIITGHHSGSGVELARELDAKLSGTGTEHAFTGLAAAWLRDGFAQFRIVSVYVAGDPREAADAVGVRRNERGANVQIIGPDDRGVFDGRGTVKGLPCVAPVQVYLDLLHLPERAAEAAEHLREEERLWRG